jgi:PDZ domain-containing protein/aspartyl protease
MTIKSAASLWLWAVSAALALCWHVNSGNPEQASAPVASNDGTFSFPAGQSAVQVPFELLANAVFVSAKVNGRGPFLFAIDTGSSGSVFASELTDELGMKPQGEAMGTGAGATYKMGVVRGKIEFNLPGGLKLSTDDANTVSMAGLWPLIGQRIYGDIGYDVLKDLVVEFDYEKKLVTFYVPADYDYSGKGQALGATLEMNYDPQIAGTFAVVGMPAVSTKFTIDTGAGGTVITTPLVKANDLFKTVTDKIPSPSHGVGGGESNDVVGRIESISLGPYKLRQPLVALSQDTTGSLAMGAIGVNVGGNILRRFTVIIDYPRRRVILEPNSHFADPFLADASGLVLKAEGSDFKTVVVQEVVSGSPAANAGLQENDVITAVDGEPVGKYALWEIQDLLKNSGHLVKLAIQRGTRSFICEFALRSLA